MIVKFHGNTILKAFILNSLAVSLIAVFAVDVDQLIDKYFLQKRERIVSKSFKSFLSFIATFIASMIVYISMFFIFGFGSGMLETNGYAFW